VNEYDWNKSEEENFQKDTGHFTQVIWKETREMGIGAAIGSNNIVICCANYYKSGNEVDKYFENVLKPSSHEIDARMNSKSNKYIKIKYLNTSIKIISDAQTDSEIIKTSSQVLSDSNLKNESKSINNNLQTQLYHEKRGDSSLSNSNNKLLVSYYFESTSIIYNDEPIQNNLLERTSNPIPVSLLVNESSCCIIL
jgi:hypothetical protein